jgi:hypothetical protein
MVKTRARSSSFTEIDHVEASGILGDVLIESNVYLGGSSVGKGLTKAATYYLSERAFRTPKPSHLCLPGVEDLDDGCDPNPDEDAFYVIDLGVVVSQVYQCEYHHHHVIAGAIK